MSNEIREDLKYTKDHEWIKIKGDIAVIGITDHAQEELTDIVFVELPEIDKNVNIGDELCVVESVKSVSEIYAPLSGTVVKINDKLEDSPEIINESPYDEGWIVEMEIGSEDDLDLLMDSNEILDVFHEEIEDEDFDDEELEESDDFDEESGYEYSDNISDY